MKERQITTLLHIINSKGNVKLLIREGLTFKKITELMEECVSQDYLTYENESIILTGKGIEFLENSLNTLKKTNKNEWIEKDVKNQIAKKDKSFIFVPRQNELTF